MPRITPIQWKKFEKFLFFVGCVFDREKGDHRIYSREGLLRPIVIPRENQLPIFIIRNNLRLLNIDHQEYLDILEQL
jgi:predicted RNA binding protein YcfA (HicA-like mRNA interferase family)